jgi:tetratricopeptide (TPR) repeat protein
MKSHLNKTALFVLFFLNTFILYAQTKTIDSLAKDLQTQKEDTNKVNTLNELAYEFTYNADSQKSFRFANQAISLAEKINYKKGKALAFFRLGISYGWHNNIAEADKNFNTALKLYQEIGDKNRIAQIYNQLGGNDGELGFYSDAIANLYSSLKINEEIGDKKAAAENLQGIGIMYWEEGNDSDALRSAREGLKLCQAIGDSTAMGQSLSFIGLLYLDVGKYVEALQNDSDAFRIYQKLGTRGPAWGTIMCYVSIADIDEKMGETAYSASDKTTAAKKYQEAYKNYLIGLNYWKESKELVNLAEIYNKVGFSQAKLNNLPAAKESFQKGLQISAKLSLREEIRNSYQGLFIVDSITGDYRHALDHYKTYILYRDSLVNEKTEKKTIQAELQYEADKKAAIAKSLEEKKDAERTMQLTGIAVFIPIFFLFVLFLSRIKVKARLVAFLAVMGLLLSYEFITDLIFPFISGWTNDSPLWETFILVVIATLIEPVNYRLERWVKTKLVHRTIHQAEIAAGTTN